MTWHRFTGSADEWDALVERLGATTPFQLSAWAAFRESFGWKPTCLITQDGTSAAQLLVKGVGPVQVAWGAGAPLGVVTPSLLRDLVDETKHLLNARVLYLRLADHAPHEPTRVASFHTAGWSMTTRPVGSLKTLVRSLDVDTAPLSASYSSNWSRNLRRGHQRGVIAEEWPSPDTQLIADIHRDVEDLKQPFHAEWRSEPAALEQLLECFRERIVIVKAHDHTGAVLAVRAAVIIGRHAYDFLAATSREGRKTYASNVALDALLGLLVARGVIDYDLGGVDPINNKGVFDFKHGAGGAESAYVGEYETAAPRMTRWVIATLIASRTS
ncbi:MAG: peptidoglycan bridge formation glycyltransferase FemA/FemB family protein [Oxalobacteraceae bacterium]|nr:peptidoglycan bridge formation glycyltransferase FemA/FemB family protein [Oxalobacteraceae bacterium]